MRECGANLKSVFDSNPAYLKAHKFFAKITLFKIFRFKGGKMKKLASFVIFIALGARVVFMFSAGGNKKELFERCY